MPHPDPSLVLLVRHGATEWSAQGRHTGRTDLPLTEAGRRQCGQLAPLVRRLIESRSLPPVVFTSGLRRANETAALTLPDHPAEETHMLLEVDYGDYEGLTNEQIVEHQPGWSVFTDGARGGESVAAISARCDSFIAKIERVAVGRPVVAFTHGHLSRFLTARLLGLAPASGVVFFNDTATVGVIESRRGALVLTGWNRTGP